MHGQPPDIWGSDAYKHEGAKDESTGGDGSEAIDKDGEENVSKAGTMFHGIILQIQYIIYIRCVRLGEDNKEKAGTTFLGRHHVSRCLC